jgi:dTDP-4-amino-4,6-dideoxygalactose transaminase
LPAVRFVTPYYASIGHRRAWQAVAGWLRGIVATRASRRAALGRTVAAALGTESAIFATGSGRSAIALCLRAAGIGPGDEVLVSSYTCLAVATGVLAAGATPVYADINPDTLNVDIATVRAALTPRVRAVIVQHTLGKPAPVDAIAAIARERNAVVIEDCALAVGSRSGPNAVGTMADAAIFSMELSKTISSGWGGILAVHDRRLADAARVQYEALREPGYWSVSRDLWQTAISAWCHQPAIYDRFGKYVLYAGFRSGLFRRSTPADEYNGIVGQGFLQKMGGAQADLARLQWRDLPAVAETCVHNAAALRAALAELNVETPGAPTAGEVAVASRVSFIARDRPDIKQYFRARGIELGEWFNGPMSPVPTAPEFNYCPGSYPNAEKVAARVVNLPSHNRLSAADIQLIITELKAYHAQRSTASG